MTLRSVFIILIAFAILGSVAVAKPQVVPKPTPLGCLPGGTNCCPFGCPTISPSTPTPIPEIVAQQGEPVFVKKAVSLSSVVIGPGQSIVVQVFCNDVQCGSETGVNWDITGIGPGLYFASLEYQFTDGVDPNFLDIVSQVGAYPQQTYVTLGDTLTDQYGNVLAVDAQNINVTIQSAPVIITPVQPTPASNLNAAVNTAVANSRCKPNSGYGPHDGCAIAFNKIMDTVLGHTVPRIEGGVAGQAAVPGAETCHNNPTTPHPCHLEWVPDVVETLLRDGYAVQIQPPAALLQGDIAVQDGSDPINGENHIGFCDNNGCSQTISNADSIAQLCGISNASYSSDGYDWDSSYQPTFYRLVKK